MKIYNLYSMKTDLNFKTNNENNKYISVKKTVINNKISKTIIFKNLNYKIKVKKILIKEIKYFFNILGITNNDHIFIVGIGNDTHTADSVGPKILKHIKVNSFLNNLGIKIKGNKVSTLEPGVLGETGILTSKIIKSVSEEIKPDLVILIDSFISEDIDLLNKTIEINNYGIDTGIGIKEINSSINNELLNCKILTIGVITGVELSLSKEKDKNYIPYLLTSKDIDSYVNEISLLIADAINTTIYNLN